MEEELKRLLRKVCSRGDVKLDEMTGTSMRHEVTKLRSVFSYLATRHLGSAATTVARILGLTPSAISKAAERGEQTISELGWLADDLLERKN